MVYRAGAPLPGTDACWPQQRLPVCVRRPLWAIPGVEHAWLCMALQCAESAMGSFRLTRDGFSSSSRGQQQWSRRTVERARWMASTHHQLAYAFSPSFLLYYIQTYFYIYFNHGLVLLKWKYLQICMWYIYTDVSCLFKNLITCRF